MNRPAVLIVEDDPLQRKLLRETLETEGYEAYAAATGREALEIIGRVPIDVAVVDFRLDGETGLTVIRDILRTNPLITPVMVTAYADVETAVAAIRGGAYDYVVKPIDVPKLLLVLERARERSKLRREVVDLRETLEERFHARNFVFGSRAMEEVAGLIVKAGRSEATVLVSGETGTGKDLVARSIHVASKRAGGPFIAVNIASLPDTLIESELFGAEKGAYTGAHERRIGKAEAAAGGTLFLDEIGDLRPDVQVKLLRFIQEREFFRLGSSRPLKADVRIIAATNRDLESAVAEGTFRSDLYYRLNVIRIVVPPLRERREDIPPLVDHFLRTFGRREGKGVRSISAEAMAVLMAQLFPGNVRELENAVERAVVFAEGETITRADLPVFLAGPREAELPLGKGLPLEERVRRLEKSEIERALRESGGVQSRAARLLGLTERVLRYKIKAYGIAKPPES
jgi:two-component system NtrC family response regulator